MLPSIEQDIKDVNIGMDIIDEALDKVNCKNKHITEGNHDDWLNKFNSEHPYLNYSFKKAARLDERGYTYHPFGKYAKFGKLWCYHGHHFASMHHARNHLLKTSG